MGCTTSLPETDAYYVPHKPDPRYQYIGAGVGAGPSPTTSMQLHVRQKLFSWSGDTFHVQHTNGANLGNGLQVKGKALSFRDQMALLDGQGKMVALCLRKFEAFARVFKIYVPFQVYPGQTPSKQQYNNSTIFLYTYCEVRATNFAMPCRHEVIMVGSTAPAYTVELAGLYPRKRLVRKGETAAALFEGETLATNPFLETLTINPGIDPCLMVCLCAILDEMDEERRD